MTTISPINPDNTAMSYSEYTQWLRAEMNYALNAKREYMARGSMCQSLKFAQYHNDLRLELSAVTAISRAAYRKAIYDAMSDQQTITQQLSMF